MHENEISEKIIGAAIEVHRILGPGLLESVHEEALRTSASSAPLRSLEGIEYGSGVDTRSFYGDDTQKSISIFHSMGCPAVFMQ